MEASREQYEAFRQNITITVRDGRGDWRIWKSHPPVLSLETHSPSTLASYHQINLLVTQSMFQTPP